MNVQSNLGTTVPVNLVMFGLKNRKLNKQKLSGMKATVAFLKHAVFVLDRRCPELLGYSKVKVDR